MAKFNQSSQGADMLHHIHKGCLERFDFSYKRISEMNNSLNWATTIVSTIYLLVLNKLWDSSLSLNNYLFISSSIYILFIVIFTFYKCYTNMFIRKNSTIISISSNKIQSYYYWLYEIEKGFSEKSKQIAEDFGNEENTEVVLISANDADKLMKWLNIFFIVDMGLFVLFLLSMPVYIITTHL